MKLSIIIPVFNEERTIKEILARVRVAPLPTGLEREVIVVDDGSSDRTRTLLEAAGSEIKKIYHGKNQGKGAAVRTGLLAATGDIVLIQDADLEYNPDEYGKLLEPILNGRADVVYGSRFVGGQSHRVLYYWHFLGNRFLTWLSNMFTNLNLTDMETCYKVFNRKAVNEIKNKLTSKRFGIEPEITALVRKFRVYEVGISYSGRTFEEGKKINWRDGLSAIWTIVKINTQEHLWPDYRFSILAFFFLIILGGGAIYFLHPVPTSDSVTYMQAMEVMKGQPAPAGFMPNRLITSSLGLALILALSKIFGLLAGWLTLNFFFYLLAGFGFYCLLKSWLSDKRAALVGTILWAGNYGVTSFGLNYLLDMGGWTFYILALAAAWQYLTTVKNNWLYLAALSIGIGGLIKEYAFVALVPLAGCFLYHRRRVILKSWKEILTVTALAFLPALLIYLYIYGHYGYTYLSWLSYNQIKYVYSNTLVEYAKNFGYLYNFGWVLFVIGLYQLVRQRQKLLPAREFYFLFLVCLSALSVFVWPAITERILTITVPALVMISALAIKSRPQNKFFILILFLYLVVSFTLTAYILPLHSFWLHWLIG